MEINRRPPSYPIQLQLLTRRRLHLRDVITDCIRALLRNEECHWTAPHVHANAVIVIVVLCCAGTASCCFMLIVKMIKGKRNETSEMLEQFHGCYRRRFSMRACTVLSNIVCNYFRARTLEVNFFDITFRKIFLIFMTTGKF